MNKSFSRFVPHAVALIIFVVVTFIYFRPVLSGKQLMQGDIERHKGMSKEIFDYRVAKNQEPLWTNSMFGGMPAYQISTLYPGNWLTTLDKVFKLFIPYPVGYFFLYFVGFYILLLCLRINPWLALIGALSYGLSSYFLIILEAGHNSKANALGYLPALFGGVILLFNNEKKWLGFAITALFTAMELNCNHVQITYYGYILIGFTIAGYFVQATTGKTFKAFGFSLALFIVASLIGALPNAGNLLLTNEYGKYSTRGKTELTINADLKSNSDNTTSGLDKNYATQWSYGIDETFSLLIPDYKGGASSSIGSVYPKALKGIKPEMREQVAGSNAYFGDQPFTSGPVYIGAIIIFFAFVGMFVIKNPIKWPIALATLLTIALSWGNNFMGLTNFFMDNVPGYNKFRAVSMILIVAEITIPLLAIMAVNELVKFSNWNEKIQLRTIKQSTSVKVVMYLSLGVVGGFCLINYFAPDTFNTLSATNEEAKLVSEYVRAGYPEAQSKSAVAEIMPEIEKARGEIVSSDAMRSLIFIALAFLVMFGYSTTKTKNLFLVYSLGIFITIDLWAVANRYLNAKSFVSKDSYKNTANRPNAADEEILKDKSLDYRVLNLNVNTFNDAQTSYFHKSIGGYHGAKLKRYAELIDFHLDKEIDFFRSNAGKAFASDSLTNAMLSKMGVINMLNTKYFIIPTGREDQPEMPLENKQANGNAWFIKSIKTVASADSEIVGLYRIDTKEAAIVNEKYKTEVGIKDTYSGNGEIKLVNYQPNELVYESNTNAEEFAVFSEIYFPKGWNAYIDGVLKPHANVDYVLRGMPIPAGKHKIEFKFEPTTYGKANTIALIGSILLLLTVGLGIYSSKKKQELVSIYKD